MVPSDPLITNNPAPLPADVAAVLSGELDDAEPGTSREVTLPTAQERIAAHGGNRYFGLIESWHFSPAAGRDYPNSDGTVSRRIADVVLVLDGGFCAVQGSIYAIRNLRSKRTVAEFSFVGRQNAAALKPMNERAKQEQKELRGFLVDEYLTWRQQTGAPTQKRTRSDSREIDGIEWEDEPAAPAPAAR